MARIGNRDALLLAALAGGATIKDAAALAGVSERTAHRRLDDPSFCQRVAQMRAEMVARALGKLADAATEAVDTLRGLLGSASDQTRLGAARSILELGSRLRESVELEQRLAELEARLTHEQTEHEPSAGPGTSRRAAGDEAAA